MNMSQTENYRREHMQALREQVAEGFLYTHARLSENTATALKAASFLYGLIEILSEQGLLSIDDLDDRKKNVAKRLVKKNSDKGVGVLLQEPEHDKYCFADEAKIDCHKRIDVCKAACCRLPFALSKQDIREGVVHWDLGQPYIIAQNPNGYCTHLQDGPYQCTVRDNRPVPCRAYDCRKDNKIWLDFDQKIINPDIRRPDWPRCVSNEKDRSDSA